MPLPEFKRSPDRWKSEPPSKLGFRLCISLRRVGRQKHQTDWGKGVDYIARVLTRGALRNLIKFLLKQSYFLLLFWGLAIASRWAIESQSRVKSEEKWVWCYQWWCWLTVKHLLAKVKIRHWDFILQQETPKCKCSQKLLAGSLYHLCICVHTKYYCYGPRHN